MKFIPAIIFLAFLFVAIWAVSCQKEPVYYGELYTEPIDTTGNNPGDTTVVVITHPCDPDSVYFEADLLPILRSNCAIPGCHDSQTHKEGVIMETFSTIRSTGKISTSNPAGSKLYRSLIDSDPNDRMPPAPKPALSAEQIALVLKWMQQGAQDLHCDNPCDTTNVTFALSVKPLLDSQCKGCHSGNQPSGNIMLTNYSQAKTLVDNGKLLGSVTHQNGFKPMPYPQGTPKMAYCDIRKIQLWIEAGAANN
ncbi:MAG: hypothetical protein KDD02_09335 [Phaeodactylibacter sp.]|nr:hypothetical protein [Phaeodactylibacter sp.]MCB9300886.1 hypothetical protein [Lewinellaceae bacterium]